MVSPQLAWKSIYSLKNPTWINIIKLNSPSLKKKKKKKHTTSRSSVGGEDGDQNRHEEVVGVSLQTDHPVADDAEYDRIYNEPRYLWRENNATEPYLNLESVEQRVRQRI